MTNIYNLIRFVQCSCRKSWLFFTVVCLSRVDNYMYESWLTSYGVGLHSYCINLSKSILQSCACGVHHCICNCSPRYSNEGRVTNITLPTGEVSGFHSNLERWSRVEVEASTREDFVTSTNLSAGDTIYTFRQGKMLL